MKNDHYHLVPNREFPPEQARLLPENCASIVMCRHANCEKALPKDFAKVVKKHPKLYE